MAPIEIAPLAQPLFDDASAPSEAALPSLPTSVELQPITLDPATLAPPEQRAGPFDREIEAQLETCLALTPRPVGFELHREGSSWLIGNGDDFGMFSFEGASDSRLGGSTNLFKGYAIHFIGGPIQTDMPPRLFELYVGYRSFGELNPYWSYDFTVSPGIYTDFEGHAHQGWRVRGLATASYHCTPNSDLVFGVAYLDRENLKLLPVGGLVINVDDFTRLELVFPEPRLSTRYESGDEVKQLYARGQLGGGSWAIERDSLANDIATYQDLGVFIGTESTDHEGKTHFSEVGYIFDRELEYRSGIGDMRFDDTLMLRSGIRY